MSSQEEHTSKRFKDVTKVVGGERVYIGEDVHQFVRFARLRLVREWMTFNRSSDRWIFRSFVLPAGVDRKTVAWIMSSLQ